MEAVKTWFRTSTPLVKTLMALSVTTLLVIGHKNFYAPYAKKQRYRRAEEWANMIEQQEMNNIVTESERRF